MMVGIEIMALAFIPIAGYHLFDILRKWKRFKSPNRIFLVIGCIVFIAYGALPLFSLL